MRHFFLASFVFLFSVVDFAHCTSLRPLSACARPGQLSNLTRPPSKAPAFLLPLRYAPFPVSASLSPSSPTFSPSSSLSFPLVFNSTLRKARTGAAGGGCWLEGEALPASFSSRGGDSASSCRSSWLAEKTAGLKRFLSEGLRRGGGVARRFLRGVRFAGSLRVLRESFLLQSLLASTFFAAHVLFVSPRVWRVPALWSGGSELSQEWIFQADSAAGFLSAAVGAALLLASRSSPHRIYRKLFLSSGEPHELQGTQLPWKRPRGSFFRCVTALSVILAAFFLSGLVAAGVEVALAFASASGLLSQSADLHRALQVLLAHLFWVGLGSAALHAFLPGFFLSASSAERQKKKLAAHLERECLELERVQAEARRAREALLSPAFSLLDDKALAATACLLAGAAGRVSREKEGTGVCGDGGRSLQEDSLPPTELLLLRRAALTHTAGFVAQKCLRLQSSLESSSEDQRKHAWRDSLSRAALALDQRARRLALSLQAEKSRLLLSNREDSEDRWFSFPIRGRTSGGLWVWWSVFGFYFSCLLFNAAETLNRWLLRRGATLWGEDPPNEDSLVRSLTDPQQNSPLALTIAAIAPCGSAPLWEEVVYRGFCLPLLARMLNLRSAIAASSFLFSAHHLSVETLLPLWVLGIAWAWVYVQSGTLAAPVAIHAMWNTRVFLSNIFEL